MSTEAIVAQAEAVIRQRVDACPYGEACRARAIARREREQRDRIQTALVEARAAGRRRRVRLPPPVRRRHQEGL